MEICLISFPRSSPRPQLFSPKRLVQATALPLSGYPSIPSFSLLSPFLRIHSYVLITVIPVYTRRIILCPQYLGQFPDECTYLAFIFISLFKNIFIYFAVAYIQVLQLPCWKLWGSCYQHAIFELPRNFIKRGWLLCHEQVNSKIYFLIWGLIIPF